MKAYPPALWSAERYPTSLNGLALNQVVALSGRGRWKELCLPPADADVLPGVQWGSAVQVFTPAYWRTQYEMVHANYAPHGLRSGRSLLEETVFCLLGGHGITYELNVAAFEALQLSGLLESHPSARALAAKLRAPLMLGGRQVHYRFPNIRATYIANAVDRFQRSCPPSPATALRAWLCEIKGIGPKTASWIVRNWLDSDDVAIIDIHIHRAGLICGLFETAHRIDRDYCEMESLYLEFCTALGVRASIMDALIWEQMRTSPTVVSDCLDGVVSADT